MIVLKFNTNSLFFSSSWLFFIYIIDINSSSFFNFLHKYFFKHNKFFFLGFSVWKWFFCYWKHCPFICLCRLNIWFFSYKKFLNTFLCWILILYLDCIGHHSFGILQFYKTVIRNTKFIYDFYSLRVYVHFKATVLLSQTRNI